MIDLIFIVAFMIIIGGPCLFVLFAAFKMIDAIEHDKLSSKERNDE